MSDLTVNPFEARRSLAETAAGRVQQGRENTEVLALIYAARQNPRDELRACDRIRDAFTRTGLAEESQYSFQRGGTDITGPSIRAAEAMRISWGNIASGWTEAARWIGVDGVGVSEVEAFAIDYETGNRESIKFQVRHWRDTKKGGYKITDERDIYELCANQAQRRKRACILALMPGDVIVMAMDQASATLRSHADTSPETMGKMIEAFAQFGVTKAHIEKRIQRRLDAIQPAQVVNLKRVYASLRDGISTASDWFEIDAQGEAGSAGGPPAESAKEVIARKRASRKGAAPAAAPPSAQEHEQAPADAPVARTLEEYVAAVHMAPDSDAAVQILDEARGFLNDAEHAQLGQAYSAKWQGGAA